MSNYLQVIKYEGDNSTFIWKHPCEDFNSGTQLIVHESQEAVFFMNGQALDSFGPGRFTLETQNLPLASGFFRRVTNGRTLFHCEIYFINKTEQMAIKWGTPSKMEYMEPTYGFPIQLGASGEMSLRVEDGRKLLCAVVGTEYGITQEQLVEKLRGFLQLRLKNYLTSLIVEKKYSVFELDSHLEEISEAMREKLWTDYLEYGMALERFFVLTIMKPEDDRNFRRFKELHFRQYSDIAEAKLRQQLGIIDQQTSAQRMVIEAQGMAQKRSLEGYSYQDERRFDVAERMAANEATGQFANVGIGLGMVSGLGNAMGGQVGKMVQESFQPPAESLSTNATPQPPEQHCSCGAKLQAGAKFCMSCGKEVEEMQTEEIQCPQCGAKVKKAKFCSECGASLLPRKCPKCGAEVQPQAKFCLECGEKLG